MINTLTYISLILSLFACSDKNSHLSPQDIKEKTCAVKVMNSFDEMNCEVYDMNILPNSTHGTIDRFISNDCMEGHGSFELVCSFKGKSSIDEEKAYFRQTWGDYRCDLSFHPLALSIWVKGEIPDKATFRFLIIQDIDQFNPKSPHDPARWQYFEYVDAQVLSKGKWTQIIMPYHLFKFVGGKDLGDNKLELNRFVGYQIELVNRSNKAWKGSIYIDKLEQLTSYIPPYKGKPKFSSIFIQPNEVYADKEWDEDFKASKLIGIDTWIVQYAEQFDDRISDKTSFYTPTALPWVSKQYGIINRMFEAASRQDVKLILGLYPGDYSKEDTNDPTQYDLLYERNKQVFDELYSLYGQHPNLAGWYITEEFHDGSFPVGWQQEPALSLLAQYIQRVAAYVKSKSLKTVCIAPALWRGMPADLCGKWFGRLFAQTPDIDVLYLQDIGGRCLVDFDVDLPNWYTEIKKACDANGVTFGVDIESFKSCWCPNIPMRGKSWEELREQLLIAGLFTDHITNFSWVTFNPNSKAYEGYKKYLNENK